MTLHNPQTMKLKTNHSLFALSVFASALLSAGSLNATIVATDGSVPGTMADATGTSGNPAEYIIGTNPSIPATVVHSSTTVVGNGVSYNQLTIQNESTLGTTGVVTIGSGAAATYNKAVVTGSGSIWNMNGNRLYVGSGSDNSLLITNGGKVNLLNSGAQVQIGSLASSRRNSLTLSNGSSLSFTVNQPFAVGYAGSDNSFVVENGASYTQTSGQFLIGGTNLSGTSTGNDLIVRGANTRVSIGTTGANSIRIGLIDADTSNTGNYALVQSGALLQIVTPSLLAIADGNFLRLAGGYIALNGNQVSLLTGLITAGKVQVPGVDGWTTDLDPSLYTINYYTTAQAGLAETFSGYSGLGGYTIMYAIPEPGLAGLLVFGSGMIAFLRRRKNLWV